MAPSGRSVASAALIGVALILFVPAFSQAADGFAGQGWVFAPYLGTVLEALPVLLVVAGAAVLLAQLFKN